MSDTPKVDRSKWFTPEGVHNYFGHDYPHPRIMAMLNALPALADEVDELRDRLEVTPYGPSTDGIACRDETILLQDQRIERQHIKIETLQDGIDGLRRRITQLLGAHSDKIQYWENGMTQALRWLDSNERRGRAM